MTLPLQPHTLAAAVAGSSRWAGLLQVTVLLATYTFTQQATIGDGRISLYTGRPINGSLSSPSPGSCEVDGNYYPSETAIPRDHPCHYCICYRSQVTCYWKQCAAAPLDCAVMHFENVCNPSLYMCNIPEKARPQPIRKYGDRISSLRRRRQPRSPAFSSSSSLRSPPSPPFDEPFPVELDEKFLSRALREARWLERSHSKADPGEHQDEDEVEDEIGGGREDDSRRKREIGNPLYRKAGDHDHHHDHPHDDNHNNDNHIHVPKDKSCTILGVRYNLGEVIGVASDVCMECRCAAGKMFCSPRCCFLPSPLSLTIALLQDLAGNPPPPARPHPLHYIRNQISKR